MSSSFSLQSLPIQPVTRRFPASQDLWEETNLPFSVVLTPLASEEGEEQEEDNDDSDSDDNDNPVVASLSSIPKCLHCGAPHASKDTHYRLGSRGSSGVAARESGVALLCFLCGRVSSTAFEQQEEKRAAVEGTLLVDAVTSTSRGVAKKKKSKRKKQSTAPPTIFELPLRLSASSASSQQHHHQYHHQQHLLPVFSVPALSCPLLWFVVLDDSCSNAQYWKTASALLLRAIETMPDFVHISILLARQEQEERNDHTSPTTTVSSLGIFQLDCPVPHVRHYYVMSGGGESNNDTEQHEEQLSLALFYSLVEASAVHKTCVQTACRSLLDYRPTTTTTATSSSTATTTSTTTTTSGFALGWTMELLLQALQTRGQAAGRQQQHRDKNDNNNNNYSNYNNSSNLLSYAGGKITCLLASRPANLTRTTTTTTRQRQQQHAARTRKPTTSAATSATTTAAAGGFGGRIAKVGTRFTTAVPPDKVEAALDLYGDDDKKNGTRSPDYSDEDNDIVDAEMGRRKPTTTTTTRQKNDNNNDKVEVVEEVDVDEEDLTPRHLQDHYQPLFPDVAVYFDELGRQFAQASMGVDLLCLVDSSYNDNNDDYSEYCYDDNDYNDNINSNNATATVLDMGLALFGNLAHKSGAPGPLVFDISAQRQQEECVDDDEEAVILHVLQREFQSRVPWQQQQGRSRRRMVFGAELRLRLPPGFCVDDSRVEPAAVQQQGKNKKRHQPAPPQLAPLYADKGLLGATASAVEESTNLWRMGTCDAHTSVTIDLAIQNRNVQTHMLVEGFGEIPVQPVIQTCFAYTTIVKDENNEYRTVRQMRIHSCAVPFCRPDDTESLYDSLDTDALAVVLFHKLALASLQDGLQETAMIAEDWLQSTLVSAYQSAEKKDKDGSLKTTTAHDNNNNNNNLSTPFLAQERLLDRQGELSDTEILLAQGHERLRTLPLMTYLLMQCDAFRPHHQQQQQQPPSSPAPPLDLRYAALSQLMSMTPSTLTRCVAPRIQLWASSTTSSAKKDEETEPILDIVDLSMEAVQFAVAEYSQTGDLILVIDSPDQIAVIDAQYFGPAKTTRQKAASSSSSSLPLVMGPALKRAIAEAARSYRTRPNILYELSYNQASRDRLIHMLTDVLMEDAPSPTGHENFQEWKTDMAQGVQEELESEVDS